MLLINNVWAGSAKITYYNKTWTKMFVFFHCRLIESFLVRFLLSSFHPVFLLSLSRSPSPSPLHSCCAVSSDHVCQALSSSSASLVVYSLLPCGGRNRRLDWLWHPLKWMLLYWLKAISQVDHNALHERHAATGLIKPSDRWIHRDRLLKGAGITFQVE